MVSRVVRFMRPTITTPETCCISGTASLTASAAGVVDHDQVGLLLERLE